MILAGLVIFVGWYLYKCYRIDQNHKKEIDK
jgi:hypothetical protein